MEMWLILDVGTCKEFQQMQVCILPLQSSRTNVEPAMFGLRQKIRSIRKLTDKPKLHGECFV